MTLRALVVLLLLVAPTKSDYVAIAMRELGHGLSLTRSATEHRGLPTVNSLVRRLDSLNP